MISRSQVDPDLSLVELAQAGSETALKALYQKYFEAIYRFCYWQTNSQPEAEDLTQEVFVAMVQSLGKFRGESLFKNWLYQIAKYHIAHWIKQKTRLPVVALWDEFQDTPDWIDPENAKLKQNLVDELLGSLKPEMRQVITLRFLKNYSVAETATKLGYTVSKVKVLTHRAIKQLKAKV